MRIPQGKRANPLHAFLVLKRVGGLHENVSAVHQHDMRRPGGEGRTIVRLSMQVHAFCCPLPCGRSPLRSRMRPPSSTGLYVFARPFFTRAAFASGHHAAM